MRRWNELTIRAKRLEKQLPGLTGEAKEVRSTLLWLALHQVTLQQPWVPLLTEQVLFIQLSSTGKLASPACPQHG
jgi:hypothetical protein